MAGCDVCFFLLVVVCCLSCVVCCKLLAVRGSLFVVR